MDEAERMADMVTQYLPWKLPRAHAAVSHLGLSPPEGLPALVPDGGSRPRMHEGSRNARFCVFRLKSGERWLTRGGCWGEGSIVLISRCLAPPNQESPQNMKVEPRNEGGRPPKEKSGQTASP